ncbi:MAG: hypothetical protein RIC52_06780, partial [Amphiplicatus sp.]
ASLAEETGVGGRQLAFTDILSRVFIILPQSLGGMLLGLGALLSLAAFVRADGGRVVGALAAPPLILITTCSLFGLQGLIGLVRPHELYWMAYPQAMQALAYFSAALFACTQLTFTARGANARRLAASAWLWISVIALGAYFVAPGSSILFVPPLAIYCAGVAIGMFFPAAERIGAWGAAILMLIIFAPVLHLVELGLGFATAAVPGVIAAIIFVTWMPLAAPERAKISDGLPVLLVTGFLAAFIAAFIVPAYSPTKPRPLNLQYYVDADARAAQWLISSTSEPAPDALAEVAPFAKAEIEGLGVRLAAPAPFLETEPPAIEALEETPTTEGRRLRIRLHARGADQVTLRLPQTARAASLLAAGRETVLTGDGAIVIGCYGRSCDGAEIEIAFGSAEPAEWMLVGVHYGLPYAAAPLVSARPDWTTPIQNGDVLIVSAKTKV